MKTTLVFALLVLISIRELLAQSTIIKNDRYHYQLNIPTGWTGINENGHIEVYLPKNGSKSKGVYIDVLTDTTYGKTLEECFDFYLGKRYQEQFDGFSIINQDRTTINNKAVMWMEHSCLKKDDTFIYLVYLIYDDNRFFQITARSNEKFYKESLDNIQKIVNSFTFKF